MPQRRDGACLYLTEDNLCEIYDSRPELCNVRTQYKRKIESEEINRFVTEIDYYRDSTEACHVLIDMYGLDEKYKIPIEEYGEKKQQSKSD
jgi:hypothetical protein|tara:strand:- start:1010 stop:1282 length:273 start_codon:yes stop_codon:yes gene_type:complete